MVLVVILILVAGASMILGHYPDLAGWSRFESDPLAQQLVFQLRMPRLLAAILLGISLAAAGLVFQMVFANPLVEPGFLGVSQGAAFGAALSIVMLSSSALTVQGVSAVFALLGLALSYLIAKRIRYGGWVLRLVLAGIAVSAFFSAGLGVLKYLADPLSQLPEITFWLLGGLYSTTWERLLPVIPVVLSGVIVIYLLRWRINILVLSEESAFSLGTQPGRERMLLLVAAVLPIAAVISIAGMIGWVGLIIPHISRRWFGTDARFSLPASILLGGIFVLICDDMARLLMAGEIPLGIITALLGALLFMVLMVLPSVKVHS